jgi:hypothetical protein
MHKSLRRALISLSPARCIPVDTQTAPILKHFFPEPIGSPLMTVSFTKGMIAADFLGDPTGTGLDMPSKRTVRVAD